MLWSLLCVLPQDEKQPHTSNIHAMVYSPGLHCIITGGEDCNIQVNYLSQESNGMQVNNFSGERDGCHWNGNAACSLEVHKGVPALATISRDH